MPEIGPGPDRKHLKGAFNFEDIPLNSTQEWHQQTALVDAEVHKQGWNIGLSVYEHRVELSC